MERWSRPLFFTLISLATLLIIQNCTSESKDSTEIDDTIDSTNQAVERTKLSAQNVFNSLPDRKEILKLVDDNRLEYDTEILNDPTNLKNYNTETFIALNLGAYGSDLSVANVFQQTQESLLFLKCVNSLAQKLGVNKAFDQTMFDRMDAQKDNKDSALQIITIAFKQADEILKQSNRPATSALIIAGVWIEGFYTSCQISKKSSSEGIIAAIIRQKETLDNIIVLLGQSGLSKEAQFVINDLTTISGILSEIIAQPDIKYTYETIATADEAIIRLRNKVVSSI
ncbi:MAG: hypothetical protein AB7O73_04490 [Bacteroidia bacterium]